VREINALNTFPSWKHRLIYHSEVFKRFYSPRLHVFCVHACVQRDFSLHICAHMCERVNERDEWFKYISIIVVPKFFR